jgi:hypothetical protein
MKGKLMCRHRSDPRAASEHKKDFRGKRDRKPRKRPGMAAPTNFKAQLPN